MSWYQQKYSSSYVASIIASTYLSYHYHVSLIMLHLPTRSTLFPYTTLFRSTADARAARADDRRRLGRSRDAHTALQRSEEHTSELQSLRHLVCRLLLEKKRYDCLSTEGVYSSRCVYYGKHKSFQSTAGFRAY